MAHPPLGAMKAGTPCPVPPKPASLPPPISSLALRSSSAFPHLRRPWVSFLLSCLADGCSLEAQYWSLQLNSCPEPSGSLLWAPQPPPNWSHNQTCKKNMVARRTRVIAYPSLQAQQQAGHRPTGPWEETKREALTHSLGVG